MAVGARFREVKGFALVAGCALVACEQFATVGILPLDVDAGPDDSDAALDGEVAAPGDGAATDDAARPQCGREVDVCDPLANTGCSEPLAMRCAPDLSAHTLAGYCTFVGPLPDAGIACLNTVVTESCPPKTTCLNGECRTLCFCDADCEDGQCCSEPLGEQGFFVCAPC